MPLLIEAKAFIAQRAVAAKEKRLTTAQKWRRERLFGRILDKMPDS